MLGLKNCTEEDFNEFRYSNTHYGVERICAYLVTLLLINMIFYGIAYGASKYNKMIIPNAVEIGLKSILVISIVGIILGIVNNKKFAFKFQKSFLVLIIIHYILLSLGLYPVFFMSIDNIRANNQIFKIGLYIVELGFVYLICLLIRFIYLIRKGEFREGCFNLYDSVFRGKLTVIGFSIPLIVCVSKSASRIMKIMNRSNVSLDMKSIFILIVAFLIQIVIFTVIPEVIILLYCKFRFDSYEESYEFHTATGKKRKKMLKEARRKELEKAEEKVEISKPKKKKKK